MESLPQPVAPQTPAVAVPRQAEHDDHLIRMWLHGRPETTRRAYQRHVDRFLALTRKPLAMITVGDVQDFADSMAHLAPRSRNQGLSAVKSLLTYGQRIGYLTFNVGAWWATATWVALIPLLVLAFWSFRNALAGQPVFRGSLLEQ